MRVLLAHNRYRISGGEERHVDLLEQGLTAAGVDVKRFDRASLGLDGSKATVHRFWVRFAPFSCP